MTSNSASLVSLLEHSVRRYPHRVAIEFLGTNITYQTLWDEVQHLAAALQTRGVGKGTKVALLLPNCPSYLRYYFATLLLGGTIVNLNPLYTAHEIEDYVMQVAADYIVTVDLAKLVDKVTPLCDGHTSVKQIIVNRFADDLPWLTKIGFHLTKFREIYRGNAACLWWHRDIVQQAAAQPEHIPSTDADNDVAVLQFTGGTTGKSKAAMLTHANLLANARQCREWFYGAEEGQEIFLAVIPFFHVFALTSILHLGIDLGATLVALPRFEQQQLLKTIHKKRPTVFQAVPTLYTAIVNAKNLHNYNLRSIKLCISGGAPLPLEIRQRFEDLTKCKLVEGYGLTECSPVACCNPLDGRPIKDKSIGLPLNDTLVEIIDPDTRGAASQGEICIRGPQVMKGYYNQLDETAKVLENGRLRTGDIGYIDTDGYVFIVDRLKDLIICGGYNVYPSHVEEMVYKHPAVEECICAGVPDDYRGEAVKIWLKLKDGQTVTKDTMRDFLTPYLSPIEMPRYIEIRDQPLPKTLIGKLSRKDVLAQEPAA